MRLSLIRSIACACLIAFVGCRSGGGSSTPAPSPLPTITSLSPSHASPGALVSLTGANFNGTTAVTFNGALAFSWTLVSATQIDAVVPANATSGPIQVTSAAGSGASSTFTVDAAQPPTITTFAPSVLTPGLEVTLTGTHFVGVTQVLFNGVSASAFTIVSDTQIKATAPAGLSLGAISVVNPGGTGSSSNYLVGSSFQVFLNTGFEQASPVIWQGDTGIIQGAPGTSNPDVVPHGGTLFAWIAGYGSVASDQISQDVYVPSTALAAKATFWLKVVTAETGSTIKDTLTVSALSTTNAVLATLLTKSNLDAGAYTAYTVDLLPYKGQIVRLSFKSQEDATNATSFALDDVSAQIMVASPSDLKPVITTFTPTSGNAGEATVQITGGNYFGVTGVSIGGVGATYTLTDGTRLSATVPATAALGSAPLSITNAQGAGTSAPANFTVTTGVPTIRRVDPAQGPVGTPVVITGTYLGSASLTLNGQAITPATLAAGQITFTVPVGATSGNLVITTPGGTASHAFSVSPSGPTLDLHVDRVELTQSTQTLDNSVPVVAGKAGLIRVFVLANQTNTATPSVRITLLNNAIPVTGYPKTVAAPGASVPTTLNEGFLSSSWNLVIPATDLTSPTGSGYSIQAEVDPANAVAEADETNNLTTVNLSGITVPIFKTTIFPVVLSSGTGNVSAANKDQWVARLAKMYPIASVDVQVGAAFTGSVSTLDANDTDGHWGTLLADLRTKHLADAATASDRYYYGALNVSYASGVAGLGYVPSLPTSSFQSRTAIGWDKTGYNDGGNYPEVFAHETGHNMGRNHSPCGGASGPDPNYPYPGALIGVWGYDSVLNQLHSPLTDYDIMGYCHPNWVSDYVYKGILDFRGGTGGFLKVGAEDAPLTKAQAQECLIVRGIVHADGSVELLPSFRTRALPSEPVSAGDYLLECQDAQGLKVYGTPLELMEVGCAPQGPVRHFVMALPLDPALLDRVAGLAVVKGGQVKGDRRGLSTAALLATPSLDLQRLSESQAQLSWDATLHPAALVRDADSGEVIAILSGGRQPFATTAKRFEVVLSDGVSSRTHPLEIPN